MTMIKRYDTLRNYKLESTPNGSKWIELYLSKFLEEKAKTPAEVSVNLHEYHVAKDGKAIWILEVRKTKTDYSVIPQRVLNPVLKKHERRMFKHHFFFSIELEVTVLENDTDSIQIVNEADNKKEIPEKVTVIGREVRMWQDFENGIKKVQINRWIEDTIVKFCTELGISGYRFNVIDYKYHFADSTVVAVYYTVINCLVDIFGLKSQNEMIVEISDLLK